MLDLFWRVSRMTTKYAFKKKYEAIVEAPSWSDEQLKAQGQMWAWNLESSIRIWDEIATERLEQYGKREWNYFAHHVMREIQEYAQAMREVNLENGLRADGRHHVDEKDNLIPKIKKEV